MTIGYDPDIKEDKVHTPRPEYPEELIKHFAPVEIKKANEKETLFSTSRLLR